MLSLIIPASFVSKAENLERLIDLEGTWKFSIGDDPVWADINYNDQDWDDVIVPKSWEGNGFNAYDGYAWYRKEFILRSGMNNESLILILGYIDDVDEVYINGHLIAGMGIMPPQVVTAYNNIRKYPLPKEILNTEGKNLIAVRVYDEYHDGGIYAGPVGIYHDSDNDLLALNLAGYWDFKTQFDVDNTNERFYSYQTEQLYVPGYWDNFGYAEFDGTATYSTRFTIPSGIDEENLMIVLGYIDDIDKVYVNDQRIGTIEDLKTGADKDKNHILILRGYTIPPGLLKKSGINILEVKVYDTGEFGGIYEGPVGLIEKDKFQYLSRKKVNPYYNFWENLFRELFD